MIKNNIIALMLHIVLIFISTLYLIALVSLSPFIGKYIVNPIIRGILVLLWAGLYVLIGARGNLRHKRKYDFQVGLLIAVLGVALWIFGFIKTGVAFGIIPEELSYHNIPLNIYLNPIYQVCFLLDIEFNQIARLVSNFIPTILIGIGIKYKRYIMTKRRYATY